MNHIRELAAEWYAAKEEERAAVETRRAIEDALKDALRIREDSEGTTTAKIDGVVIKVTGRIDRKVDAEMVQELAAEAGLTEHLSSLFRWKPEINLSAWKAADASITGPLSAAITAKPGRPSFSITIEEQQNGNS